MDLSIIIPCYNCEKTILKTLDALLVQKDNNYSFEIIAVDNNSNDNTKNLLLDYKSKSYPDLNYVFEPNPGSANARNAGLEKAKGKIIVLIDSDIIVNRNWMNELLAPFSDDKVAIVGGKIELSWYNGNPPEWFHRFSWILGELDHGSKPRILDHNKHINAGNYAIRTSLFKLVGGYPPCDAPNDQVVGDGECGLTRSIRALGHEVFWAPKASCQHLNDSKIITPDYMMHRFIQHGKANAFKTKKQIKETDDILNHVTSCIVSLYNLTNAIMRDIFKDRLNNRRRYWEIRKVIGDLKYFIFLNFIEIFKRQ
jgi:glycosyltransferase involved in cell wall biosynthesis